MRGASLLLPLLPTLLLPTLLLALLLVAACRDDGLARQPKATAYEAAQALPRQAAAQPPPAHTVARPAPAGLRPASPAAAPRSGADLLARGRERFAIFCLPCHGADGGGGGEVVRRGFPAPPSLHSPRLRAAPASHVLRVIAEGQGAMYPYGARVPPADRRAILAYIRALQLAGPTAAGGEEAR